MLFAFYVVCFQDRVFCFILRRGAINIFFMKLMSLSHTKLMKQEYPFQFQCQLASMVTSTASVSRKLIEVKKRVFKFLVLSIQNCSVCDDNQPCSSRFRTCTNCSALKLRHSVHHNCYHHHHKRNRAIKQTKRCTFATNTTEIPNSNELIGEEYPHMSFKNQSSNSSNASSVRIIE